MLKMIADILFGIGWVVGGIKYGLGFIVEIPEKYWRRIE